MEWALRTAAQHPDLRDSFLTVDDQWLDILLPDGRSFRFRPAALLKEDSPLELRTELLNRLLTIGIKNATASETSETTSQADPETDSPQTLNSASVQAENMQADKVQADDTAKKKHQEPDSETAGKLNAHTDGTAFASNNHHIILPIVRNAAYFLPSHQGEDSIVYIPLTDFIAAGIAENSSEKISPIYYSQLTGDFREAGEILSESVLALRELTDSFNHALRLDVMRLAGAEVLTFTQPADYVSSWFADLELMQQLNQQLAAATHQDSLQLFVPAARTKLYLVRDDDPHLVDFFKELLATSDSPEAIYPLPHTVAADGWREWIPLAGSPLAEVLGALRGKFRQKIYAEQVRQMLNWSDFGALKPYQPKVLHHGERVSNTVWSDTDGFGSVPDTDFITFLREPSPHPWENKSALKFSIRAHIAREIWADGIKRDVNAWPPRWNIYGFPDDATLAKLLEASTREF